MISRTTARFRSALGDLEPDIKRQARRAYQLFKRNPHHPTLQFKKVHPSEPIWSVRIVGGYRAVGVRAEDEIVWYWIGSHADYDRLLSQRFEVGSTDSRTTISLLLQRQRHKSGLSLAQAAARLGVKSRNAYARYERGASVPTVEKLDELLRAVAPGSNIVLRQSAA